MILPMSLDDTNQNFKPLSIIYHHKMFETFSSGNLYSDIFLGNTLQLLHHQLEIENCFCCRNSKSYMNAKDKDEVLPSSQGLMETWLQVWQERLWRCCCWTRIDCQRLSCAHAEPRAAAHPAAAPASWPRPACCVFNL